MYPSRTLNTRNWEIREVVGNKYKSTSDKENTNISQNIKIRIKIELNKNVYLKDLEQILVGKYHEETSKWSFDNIDNIEFNKDQKSVFFYTNELAPYSILLERKIFFPYKSWYLRCISDHTAVLDLESNNKNFKFYLAPRLNFVFEIGINYVKLRDNHDPEFSHIVNKEFNYETLLHKLRNCGVILYPLEEDIVNVGLNVKNHESNDRAINDIVLACGQYAIKSSNVNCYHESDIIVAKFKPNIEYDFKFFDDEEVIQIF